MMWSLPTAVTIDGEEYNIRNRCDYRVVLDVIEALSDAELEMEDRLRCALFIFYEDISKCTDISVAIKEMFKIINNGQEDEQKQEEKPRLMDWKHDFSSIAPPISRVLGYEVRMPDRFTHWYTWLGAYMEIGECFFSTVVSIREKRQKGKALEKWEQDFYRQNKKIVDLPQNLTEEEKEWLSSDW